MESTWLLERMIILVPLLLSLTVHEWAHAYSAWRLGDDTASLMGRMTLNPIVHIDPIGTLLLPLLGVPFGWAKPVPVNPARFRRDVSMSKGMMITAMAGPASNIVLAVVFTVALGLLVRLAPGFLHGNEAIAVLLRSMVQINVILAIFNMIPVPPLDGSRVVDGLVPYRLRDKWEAVTRFSPFLLLGVIFFAGVIIAGPAAFVSSQLHRLLLAVAG